MVHQYVSQLMDSQVTDVELNELLLVLIGVSFWSRT
jgi:hypothetical protein